MSADIIPTELIDLFIDELGAQIDFNDPQFPSSPPYLALLSTSLISREHVERSRKHLLSCLVIRDLPKSPKALRQVQQSVQRLEVDLLARSYVRRLWLEPSTKRLDLKVYQGLNLTEPINNAETRIDHGLSQILCLLSGALVDITLRGDGSFGRVAFWKALGASIQSTSLIHLHHITIDCSDIVPAAFLHYLPSSLHVFRVMERVGIGFSDLRFTGKPKITGSMPLESRHAGLRSLSSRAGFLNGVIDILQARGFLGHLAEFEVLVLFPEISSTISLLKHSQSLLENLVVHFGSEYLLCTFSQYGSFRTLDNTEAVQAANLLTLLSSSIIEYRWRIPSPFLVSRTPQSKCKSTL